MPGVVVDHADMVTEGKFLFIGNRPELLKRPHGVLHRIERVHRLRTAARAFPIPHFCVGDLYMSRIWKHNLRKVAGRFCRVDRPLETFSAQLRNETAVVNVGVGQEHRIQFGGRKQKIFLIQFLDSLRPLEHATINQDFCVLYFQHIARARYRVSRTQKSQPHTDTLLSFLLSGVLADNTNFRC